uniref:Saposin B-type domain-containing protein n=1 Tax=Bursaphelenchus xylophilus TaxID=6326 RepID=A0A1I7SHP7_BURXY
MRSFLVIFGALYLAGATVDNALKGCPPAMNSFSKHTLVMKNGTVNQAAFNMLMNSPVCGVCRELMEDLKPLIVAATITEEAVQEAVEKICVRTFGDFFKWPCKWAFSPTIQLMVQILNKVNHDSNITYICDTIHLC